MSLGERAKLTIAPYTAPAPPVAVGIGADMGVCLVTMGMVLVDFRLYY
jgi:hypothetical protein